MATINKVSIKDEIYNINTPYFSSGNGLVVNGNDWVIDSIMDSQIDGFSIKVKAPSHITAATTLNGIAIKCKTLVNQGEIAEFVLDKTNAFWSCDTKNLFKSSELNFIENGFNGSVYINYQAANRGTGTVKGYIFMNGNREYSPVKASSFLNQSGTNILNTVNKLISTSNGANTELPTFCSLGDSFEFTNQIDVNANTVSGQKNRLSLFPFTDNANAVMTFQRCNNWGDGTHYYISQLGFNSKGEIYYRSSNNKKLHNITTSGEVSSTPWSRIITDYKGSGNIKILNTHTGYDGSVTPDFDSTSGAKLTFRNEYHNQQFAQLAFTHSDDNSENYSWSLHLIGKEVNSVNTGCFIAPAIIAKINESDTASTGKIIAQRSVTTPILYANQIFDYNDKNILQTISALETAVEELKNSGGSVDLSGLTNRVTVLENGITNLGTGVYVHSVVTDLDHANANTIFNARSEHEGQPVLNSPDQGDSVAYSGITFLKLSDPKTNFQISTGYSQTDNKTYSYGSLCFREQYVNAEKEVIWGAWSKIFNSGSSLSPLKTNYFDIGNGTYRYKDLYLSGIINISNGRESTRLNGSGQIFTNEITTQTLSATKTISAPTLSATETISTETLSATETISTKALSATTQLTTPAIKFTDSDDTPRYIIMEDSQTCDLTINAGGGSVKSLNSIWAPSFYETSDIRKKNILGDLDLERCKKLLDCSDIIYKLKGDDQEQIGMIAQEVEKVFPELVKTGSDGFKSIDYTRLGVICLRLMKELYERK